MRGRTAQTSRRRRRTRSELLLARLNAQMYGTLQQCAAAIDAYFDGLAEDHCEPFIDPAIGALVNSTLNDVERATEEEAREFFDAARRGSSWR